MEVGPQPVWMKLGKGPFQMSGVEHSGVCTVARVGDYMGVVERRRLGSEILIQLFYGSPYVCNKTPLPQQRVYGKLRHWL